MIDAGERLRYARSVDRRQFPRVNAPVFCRPVGRPLFRRRTADVSLGGMRLFADEAPKQGDRLELELFLPGEIEITCRVEVVWTEELPEGAPARFDVGVKFVDIGPQDRERLALVLKPD
jgi:c-di-GMP-binding flagellar brake protein YcgR